MHGMTYGYNSGPAAPRREVYYTGTDRIVSGYALCHDWDHATLANRFGYVEKPSLNNIGHFAGIVAPGYDFVGPGPVEVVLPNMGMFAGVAVYTDQNVLAGDYLGVLPGQYEFGKHLFGDPLFRALEAQDRSVTAGTVVGQWGGVGYDNDWSEKFFQVLDSIASITTGAAPATALIPPWVVTLGTSSTLAVADTAGGAIELSAISTGFQANLQSAIENIILSTGKAAFFRARIRLDSVASVAAAFVGLSVRDTTIMTQTTGAMNSSDHFGVRALDGALTVPHQKGGSGAVAPALTPTMSANVFLDVAFLLQNRAGTPSGRVWVDEALQSVTLTAAEIPDNTELAASVEVCATVATKVLRLDRLEVAHYFG